MGLNSRIVALDVLRGVAIILMIGFHFCFDLNHFGLVALDIYYGDFWRYFRFLIVTLFIFVSGYTLTVVHQEGIKWRFALNRSARLAGLALIISAVTYVLFPHSWIYFGVIHFFALASIVVLPLVPFPKISLLLAMVLYALYWVDVLHLHVLFEWFHAHFGLPRHSEDLVSLIPWITPMLVGIFAGHYVVFPSISRGTITQSIAFLGRHALAVYMIHQPILFGSLWLVALLFS